MSPYTLSLREIQPSQLFISRKKLDHIQRFFDEEKQHELEPIPIKLFDGHLMSTDGHTRALGWHLNGYDTVETVWEDVEMDWEAYSICVEWCRSEGITSIPDLERRIIPHDRYEILWLERCHVMQEELEQERRQH